MSEELIQKIGRILAISPRRVENMTFVKIIEALVEAFDLPKETKERRAYVHRPKRKMLWNLYQHMAVVSYKTFIRRMEQHNMTPYEAATKPRSNGNQFSRKGE